MQFELNNMSWKGYVCLGLVCFAWAALLTFTDMRYTIGGSTNSNNVSSADARIATPAERTWSARIAGLIGVGLVGYAVVRRRAEGERG